MSSGAKSVLFVGDLSYADRYKYHDVGVRWDSWGRFVEPSTAYQPWIWNTGNHEIEYMPYMVNSCNTVQVHMFNKGVAKCYMQNYSNVLKNRLFFLF